MTRTLTVEEKIAEAAHSNAAELDLSFSNLSELPESLRDLSDLTSLNVRGNQLSTLPDWMAEFKNLTKLYLGSNQLSILPDWMAEFKNLTILGLDSNQLSTLPDWMAEFKNLTILGLGSNQLSTLPDWMAEFKNLTILGLRGCKISTLPDWMAEFKNLTKLDLANNQLSTLPDWMAEFKNLTTLSLGSNQLSTLPDWMAEFKNLTKLSLENNQLSTLPDWMAEFKNLAELDLDSNQLSTLPDWMAEFKNLTKLYLDSNQLSTLPDWMAEFKNLTTLSLGSNQLSTLPDWMAEFKNLTILGLRGCKISTLPDWMAEFKNLTQLYLANNQLSTLPDWMAEFKNLTILGLANNQLSTLPDWMAEFKNLTELYLDSNQLSTLPDWMAEFKNLTQLDLRGCKISTLPDWMAEFKNLTQLDLRHNSLKIPQEILADWQNAPRILKYLADLKKQKRPLNEAKMVLVGEAKNGKTSLAKRLRGEPFDPSEAKTDGIDIRPWEVKVGERTIKLNVWDLGGQEIYHATHQFFLTERTLYVLVLNSRQSETQNRLDYWLKTIRTLGNDAPILVVQNHHETNPQELNRQHLMEKYPTIVGFHQTSCAKSRGIAALQNDIKKVVAKMPHVSDAVPATYFEVKQRLEEDQRDFLPLDEYEALCDAHALDDPESKKILLRLLHELGTILNFSDYRLRDTNVLNPEWVTDGVYKILDHPPLRKSDQAILRLETLEKVLPVKRYPPSKQRFVVEMMMKFELCFQRDGRDEWLIPELLAPAEPKGQGDFTDALRFEYHYDFLPSSVLPRFIVRTHTLNQTHYWRDGVVLEEQGNTARVRADLDDKKIKIEVTGPPNTRRDLLAMIRREFSHIHNTLKGMDYKEMVLIPGYPDAEPVSYKFLLELERDREETFRCEGVPIRVSVSELLNGIEAKRFTPSEPELSDTKPPKKEEAKPMSSVNLDVELKPLSDIIKVANDNDGYLRELARAVQKDKIVPFVGAGMSQPVGMKGWVGTLDDIFTDAKLTLSLDAGMAFAAAKATGKLDEAAQALWDAMKEKWFNDRIKALFGRNTLPARADAIQAAPVSLLPKIANGPVITTNFDAILETVYGDFDPHRDIILGDYRTDEMLEDFDDKRHFLLKLHGDADQKWGRVLTQAQYDRAYSTDKEVSRLPELLQEIARSRRPLLFVGCSLELDRTVQELQTAGLMTSNAIHFALLKDPGEPTRTIRRNFLVGELGIKPIWLRDYDDIRPVLEFLVRVRA